MTDGIGKAKAARNATRWTIALALLLLLAGHFAQSGAAREGDAPSPGKREAPNSRRATPSLPGAADSDPAAQAIRLLFTGNRQGLLRPCNCVGRVGTAGADVEATLFRNLETTASPTPVVRLDTGTFAALDRIDISRLRTAYCLQGLARLRFDAINVAATDCDHGIENLREAARRYNLPLVSANLVDPENGDPLFPTSRLVETKTAVQAPPLRIGITGITHMVPDEYPLGVVPRDGLPGYFPVEGPPPIPREKERRHPRRYRTAPPETALRREVERLRSECDLVVVLGAVPLATASLLTKAIPGIDIFAVGGDPTQSDSLFFRDGTWFVVKGPQAVQVSELAIRRGPGGELDRESAATAIHDLTGGLKPDPDLAALTKAQLLAETLADLSFRFVGPPVARPVATRYAGAATCRDCHFEVHSQWAGSAHATAFDPLEARRTARNPVCAACHATGQGRPGGFTSPDDTPGLAGVQCEACHGPSGAHVAWALRAWRMEYRGLAEDVQRATQPTTLPRRPTVADCRTCHTGAFDPSAFLSGGEPPPRRLDPKTAHNLSRN